MDLQEWKNLKRKKVTLTSGLEVTVRQLPPLVLGELGPIPGLEPIEPENQWRSAKMIIQAGVESPKIGEGPDEISFADLSAEDITELTEAIMKIGVRQDPTVATDSSEAAPQS